jgi:hypothetical protein
MKLSSARARDITRALQRSASRASARDVRWLRDLLANSRTPRLTRGVATGEITERIVARFLCGVVHPNNRPGVDVTAPRIGAVQVKTRLRIDCSISAFSAGREMSADAYAFVIWGETGEIIEAYLASSTLVRALMKNTVGGDRIKLSDLRARAGIAVNQRSLASLEVWSRPSHRKRAREYALKAAETKRRSLAV